jgi:hypothetical protein
MFIFLSDADGTIGDRIDVGIRPADHFVQLEILSSVEGVPFPFLPAALPAACSLPNNVTCAFEIIPETGAFQDVTDFVFAHVSPDIGLQLSASMTFFARSDVEGDSTAVPEPATLALTALGVGGVVTRYRRRSRSAS